MKGQLRGDLRHPVAVRRFLARLYATIEVRTPAAQPRERLEQRLIRLAGAVVLDALPPRHA